MTLNISSTLLYFNKKSFLIEIFRVDRRDANCPTNVTIGNDFEAKFLLAAIEFVFSSAFPSSHQPIALLNKFKYFRILLLSKNYLEM